MAQFARPDSDVSAGPYTPTPLWSEIDDPVGSGDGSTISSTTANSTETFRVGLTNITDPGVHTGHVLRVRGRKSASGGRTIALNGRLRQGSTIITDQTASNISDTMTTFTFTLSATEAGNITDYSALDIEVLKLVSGSGAGRALIVADAEFEVPDAGGLFFQTLNATAAALAQYGGFKTTKILLAQAAAASAMVRQTSKALLGTAPAQASVLKRGFVTLPTTTPANAAIQSASVFGTTLNATALAGASIQLQAIFTELLNAVATGIATLTTRSEFFRVLNASAGASANMVKKTSIAVLASALATATEIHSATYNVSLAASAQAIAQMLKMPQTVINANASALADLNGVFIPGGGGSDPIRFWTRVLQHLLVQTRP